MADTLKKISEFWAGIKDAIVSIVSFTDGENSKGIPFVQAFIDMMRDFFGGASEAAATLEDE
ncbi:MAG: hypothetical protein IJU56_09000 [Clostridia bacterium]|nr:hypothetical protein [Clostridia bacterium]